MSWRPEDWKNPYQEQLDVRDGVGIKARQWDILVEAITTYEAGADAMHKADIEWLKEHNIAKDKSCIVISDDSWLEFQGKL